MRSLVSWCDWGVVNKAYFHISRLDGNFKWKLVPMDRAENLVKKITVNVLIEALGIDFSMGLI